MLSHVEAVSLFQQAEILCRLVHVRRHLRPLCASAVQLMTVLTAAKPGSMALAPQVYLMTELLHAVELYLPPTNKNPFAKPASQAGASGDTSCSGCHTATGKFLALQKEL